MSADYTVVCLSETLAPITHMIGVSGNEALVAREPVVTDRGLAFVPVLSGNAVRHRLLREPGALWLIERYGWAGTLDLRQLNFLLHGGNLTEGGGRENTARIADFQRIFPLLRLLGGTLPDQILSGSLQAWRGALVCEENRPYLEHVLKAVPDALPERLRAAESFVSGYQYTRGDVVTTNGHLLPPPRTDLLGAADAKPPDSNLMIFSGQAVTRGAAFLHGFTLSHVSELELGALFWSLALWRRAGGTIGGQSARGHGRLALSVLASDGIDPEAAMAAYRAHAEAVRDEVTAWLHGVFAPRAEKPKKGKPGKDKEAADAPRP